MHHSDVEDVKDRGEDLVEVQPQLSSQIGRTTGKTTSCFRVLLKSTKCKDINLSPQDLDMLSLFSKKKSILLLHVKFYIILQHSTYKSLGEKVYLYQ